MFSAAVTQQSPTEVIKVLVMAIKGSDLESSPVTLFFLVCTFLINSFHY